MAQPIGALRAALSASSASFEQDMRQARNAVRTNARGMETAMSRVRRTFTRVLRSVFSFRSAIGTLAGSAGMGLLIKRSIEAADTIAKTADSIGISTDALQEYRYIAERSGVATSALDNGLGAFTRRLGQMRQGTGQLNSEMEKFDVALRDQMASANSAGDALNIFFRALEDVENQSDRAALMAAAFGRTAGVAMTNMVGQTDVLRQRFHRLGLSIDEDVLRKAESGKDSIDDLGQVIRTSFMRAMLELAPSIGDAADSMADWVGENKDFITQDIPETMRQVAAAIGAVARAAHWAAGGVKSLSEGFAETIYGPATVEGHMQNQIRDLNEELEQLLETRRAIEQGQTMTGSTVLGGWQRTDEQGIEEIEDQIARTRRQIDFLENQLESMGNAGKDAGEKTVEEIEKIGAAAEKTHKVLSAMFDKPEGAGPVLMPFEGVEQHFIDTADAMDKMRQEVNVGVAQSITSLNEMEGKTKDTAGVMENAFDGWASNMSSQLNDIVWQADTSFKDIARSFAQMLTQMAIQRMIVAPMLGGAGSWLDGLLASEHGNVFSGGHHVQRYAKGGVVTRPTIFPMAQGAGLMGEAGHEAIMPLTRIGGDLGVRATPSNVEVNVINKSGVDVDAKAGQPRMEGDKWVMHVVLDAVNRDRGGFRTGLKAGLGK